MIGSMAIPGRIEGVHSGLRRVHPPMLALALLAAVPLARASIASWAVFAGGFDSYDGSDAGKYTCSPAHSLDACATTCQVQCEGMKPAGCTGFDLNFCSPLPSSPGTCYFRSEPPAKLIAARSVQLCYGAKNKTLFVWKDAPPLPPPPPPPAPAMVAVSVDLRKEAPTPTAFKHFWKRCFGSGHAGLTLRQDWRKAAAAAVQDLGLQAVRFHGLFDEDMGPVSRQPDGSLRYNYSSIDSTLDFQVKHGMVPILEMGFMPAALAGCTLIDRDLNNKTFNPGHDLCPGRGDGYQGVLRPPLHWDEWYDFVRHFVQHWTRRYGQETVAQWRFECWNELMGSSFGVFSSC